MMSGDVQQHPRSLAPPIEPGVPPCTPLTDEKVPSTEKHDDTDQHVHLTIGGLLVFSDLLLPGLGRKRWREDLVRNQEWCHPSTGEAICVASVSK